MVIFFHVDKNSHHFQNVLRNQSKRFLNQLKSTLPKEEKKSALLFPFFSQSISINCIHVLIDFSAASGNFF
ncbi:MAG: hypothetical protein WCG25_09915 [bacterium]